MATRKYTIALLGASGQTGLEAVKQALGRGHKVKAIVRNPEKITEQHENLSVIQGDIFSSNSLKQAFADCDAVMSCLGGREKTFYLDYMQNVIPAMRTCGIKRLIVMTSWGTKKHPDSPYMIDYVMRLIIASVLDSMAAMEDYLMAQCGDMDYTVVRPPGLTNKPVTERMIETEENSMVVHQGICGTRFAISRADVARFMLDTLEGGNFRKVMVAIL